MAWDCGVCIIWIAFGCHGGSTAEVARGNRHDNAFAEKEFNGVRAPKRRPPAVHRSAVLEIC